MLKWDSIRDAVCHAESRNGQSWKADGFDAKPMKKSELGLLQPIDRGRVVWCTRSSHPPTRCVGYDRRFGKSCDGRVVVLRSNDMCKHASMEYEQAQTHESCRSFVEKDVRATVEMNSFECVWVGNLTMSRSKIRVRYLEIKIRRITKSFWQTKQLYLPNAPPFSKRTNDGIAFSHYRTVMWEARYHFIISSLRSAGLSLLSRLPSAHLFRSKR